MHGILTVMAIESLAPDVRTVAEVNNPSHVEHFQRAHADEVLVTSSLASHLVARSALYPGLTGLVSDIVTGGEGSELYRVELPERYLGLHIDEVSTRLRHEHRATLLAIGRGTQTVVNPPTDFHLQAGDDLLVVAESLGNARPAQARSRNGAERRAPRSRAHARAREGAGLTLAAGARIPGLNAAGTVRTPAGTVRIPAAKPPAG